MQKGILNIMDNTRYIFSSTAEELQKNIHRLKSTAMRQFGLGTSDLACMIELKHTPQGLTSTELSRVCHVDKALISRTVKKLISMNLLVYETPRIVRNEESDPDTAETDGNAENPKKPVRRGAYRIRLQLTEAGEKMADRICNIASEAAAYATQTISDCEMERFNATLSEINERFKQYMKDIFHQEPNEELLGWSGKDSDL